MFMYYVANSSAGETPEDFSHRVNAIFDRYRAAQLMVNYVAMQSPEPTIFVQIGKGEPVWAQTPQGNVNTGQVRFIDLPEAEVNAEVEKYERLQKARAARGAGAAGIIDR